MNPQPQPSLKNSQHGQNRAKNYVNKTKPSVTPKKKLVFKTEELCPYCSLSIPISSLDVHVVNCEKNKPAFKSTREIRVYDSFAARVQGTGAEVYHLGHFKSKQDQSSKKLVKRNSFSKDSLSSIMTEIGTKADPRKPNLKINFNKTESTSAIISPAPAAKANWRQTHNSTIESIRAHRRFAAEEKLEEEISEAINCNKANSDPNFSINAESETSNWRKIHDSTLQSIRNDRRFTVMNNKTTMLMGDHEDLPIQVYEGRQKPSISTD